MRVAPHVALLLVLSAVPVAAQSHTMPVVIEPDRILIGAEFVPRYLDLPVVKTVAAGESDVLAAGVYDYIEIEGQLTIPAGVTIYVTHLFVLPGGTLNVACGATVVGRNVPINTTADPFQWGNGLLNFGRLVASCPEKTPFVVIADAASGSTALQFSTPSVGWSAGDVVMLPDTRQMNTAGNATIRPRREPNATITSIAGSTLILSAPLTFARTSVKRPDGSTVVAPRVANLSRRTTIRSENPSGVRWHVANVGHDSAWTVEGVAFVGLGRTKNEPLNNTSLGSNIGTNQVGRYAFHIHHVGTSMETRRIAWSAFDGQNGGKWAIAVHQSHDTEVIGNVCVDTPGGCFVTEDGNETRNVFRGNFAAFATGNGGGSVQNVDKGCPGCESAYWFRGVNNVIEGNEAWNSQMGFNLFNQRHQGKTNPVPVAKGSMTTVVPNLQTAVPISMTENIVAANAVHGLEYWSMVPFPNQSMTMAHNGQRQAWNAFPERTAEMYFVDGIVTCAGGVSLGIVSGQGYTTGLEMLRGEIRGCDVGLAHGIGRSYGRITETVLQNVSNISFIQFGAWPVDLQLTRVRHEPFGTAKPHYIGSIPMAAWSGTGPYPGDAGLWSLSGTNITVTDWQGTGENYRIVYPAQVGTSLAWPATNPNIHFALPPPECGKTIAETWVKCGLALKNETFAAGASVALPGLVNLTAIPGPPPPLLTPKAIMTTPNSAGAHTNRINADGSIWLDFALTGNPALADNKAYLSVDGGPRRVTSYRRGGPQAPYYVAISSANVTNGAHTVRTWRELNGVEVAGSSMTFGYVIGTTPPPPPPVDCVLSPSTFTTTDWTLSGLTYSRTETESKTILTAPAHGGAVCVP